MMKMKCLISILVISVPRFVKTAFAVWWVIDMYWDLLGNFTSYTLPPDKPLTKFDHEEFTQEDYQKLNSILADQRSLLGKYKVEDLIDRHTQKVSEKVDAVTGATKKTVQNAVVGGAVYSSYTLWHLANGEISEKIEQHTRKLVADTLIRKMISSNNYHYQYFALDHIASSQYERYRPEILSLLLHARCLCIPLCPTATTCRALATIVMAGVADVSISGFTLSDAK